MARSIVTTFVFVIGMAGAASAQPSQTPPQTPPPAASPTNGGLGPKIDNPAQVDPGQNMILPSAGESKPSAAPTMVYDCAKEPQKCTPPAQPGDKATAPALSDTSKKP